MFGWHRRGRGSGGCKCGNARIATIAGLFQERRAGCAVFGARMPQRSCWNGGMKMCFRALALMVVTIMAEVLGEDPWVERGCWEEVSVADWKQAAPKVQHGERRWAGWLELDLKQNRGRTSGFQRGRDKTGEKWGGGRPRRPKEAGMTGRRMEDGSKVGLVRAKGERR